MLLFEVLQAPRSNDSALIEYSRHVKRPIAIDLDAFKMAVNTLGKNDQRKVLVVVLLQVFLGGLDLLGVATVGVLGSLAIRGIQSTPARVSIRQMVLSLTWLNHSELVWK